MPSADPHARAHGGPNPEELCALGLDYPALLDLSVSLNPYGPHPAMLAALRAAAFERYPDPQATAAREALAHWLRLPVRSVRLGNGAAELLWAIARSVLAPGSCLLMVEPTFCELRAAALACGARVEEWRARAADDFAVDLHAVSERAAQVQATAVYLCSPNAPTGVTTSAAEIARWAARQPFSLVLDQSFLSLSDAYDDAAVRFSDNVVVVRSLTKDHAIPGARVGYAFGHPQLWDRVDSQSPAWAASALAQAAACAAPTLDAFVRDSRERLRHDRRELTVALERLGLTSAPSRAPFLLVHAGARAGAVRDHLLQVHGILVRDCTSFGLPEHLRVAVCAEPARARLLRALQEARA